MFDNIEVLPSPPHALSRTRNHEDAACKDGWDEYSIDKVGGLEVSNLLRQQLVCECSNQFINQVLLSILLAICTDVTAQILGPLRCRDWEY